MRIVVEYIIKLLKKIRLYSLKSNLKKNLASFGANSYVESILRLQGAENISIGSRVVINANAWLASKPLTGLGESELKIDDYCFIGDYCHFWSTHSIRVEKKVIMANHVYIADNMHGYENIELPVIDQPIVQKRDVIIGEGSWLGENVCVIGANVGKHCVIGANSVVTHDIPDYCVAVGAPARVIKRYNFDSKLWEKTDPKGNFLGN